MYHEAECEEDASGGVTLESGAAQLTVRCDTARYGLAKQRCEAIHLASDPFCVIRCSLKLRPEKMPI